MALVFAAIWPTTAAGVMTITGARVGLFFRGVTAGAASLLYWTDDGTTTGFELHVASPQVEPPMPWVMMEGADGAWSPMGCYGPVIAPNGEAANGSRDLFFHRLERVAGGGIQPWYSTVFSGGPDSGGYVQTFGRGRAFFGYLFG